MTLEDLFAKCDHVGGCIVWRGIRHALAQGKTQREAGAPFGASQVHVSQIALGKVWRHVI